MLVSIVISLVLAVPLVVKNFSRLPKYFWILLGAIFLLILQGAFMYYNAESELVKIAINRGKTFQWILISNTEQGFPNLPGVPDRSEALDRLGAIIPLLLSIFSVALLIRYQIIKSSTLLNYIFWVGVSLAILGLAQKLTGAQGIFWLDAFSNKYRKLFFATYRNPGAAACYLNLCLVLGLFNLSNTVYQFSKKSKSSIAYLSMLVVGVVILFVAAVSTGSKTGAFSTFMTLFFWFFFNLRVHIKICKNGHLYFPGTSGLERKLLFYSMCVVLVIGVIAISGTLVQRWTHSFGSDHGSLRSRMLFVEVMKDMVHGEGWGALGYGPGAFYPLYPFYKNAYPELAGNNLFYAHNDPMQTLVEWGWLGTGMFLVIGIGACVLLSNLAWAKRGTVSRESIFYSRAVLIGLIMVTLHSFIDFPYQIESIAFLISVFIGVGWGIRQPQKN